MKRKTKMDGGKGGRFWGFRMEIKKELQFALGKDYFC
jgi:hypothetical protein